MDPSSTDFAYTSPSVELFVSNSTENVSSSSPVVFRDHCFGFQFLLNTVIFGSLCILGFFGNIVSIVVLQRDNHNKVPIFLLQSLAIADNSVLLLSFIALSIFYGLLPFISEEAQRRAQPHIVQYLNPLGCAAQSFAIWMTVLIALNRYSAVCRPFTSQKWLTITHARLQVFVILIISILLNIPRVFQIVESKARHSTHSTIASWTLNASTDLLTASNGTREHSMQSLFWYFEVVYLNAFYTSVVLILPLFLLIGFNIPLMRELQRSKRLMAANSLSYNGQQENSITVVMVIIILEMIVCHAPDRVVQIVRFFTEGDRRSCPFPLFYAQNVSNFLVMLSSSSNFVIYYVFRRRFRAILCSRLRCCQAEAGQRKACNCSIVDRLKQSLISREGDEGDVRSAETPRNRQKPMTGVSPLCTLQR